MFQTDTIQRTDLTPYVSSGGYSMPSVGSSVPAPVSEPRVAVPRATDPTPSAPTISDILKGGPSVITDYFNPTPINVLTRPSDGTPSIQIGGHTITPSVPGASGTPSGTPASGGSTSVPAVGQDYFHDVLDLITAQLTTGQPSATQQFSATPIALPSGGSYDGASGDAGGTAGVSAPRWPVILAVVLVGGGLYYWFVWRKKHGKGGDA